MRRRSCILVVALLVLALMPTTAMARGSKAAAPARGIRPQIATLDAYEPDDTTATAKALPAESLHTNDYRGPLDGDVDWYTFTADATGQPFVLDTEYLEDGYFDPYMAVYKAEPDGSMTLLTEDNDDMSMFWSYAPALYFEAPAPGTYYGRVQSYDGEYGVYRTFIAEGISRRLGGANRFETAAKISKMMFGNTTNMSWGGSAGPMAILLANSKDAPDAITAGALGAMFTVDTDEWEAPMLLTTRDSMPDVTKNEIERLAYGQQTTVYVLGGPSQISDAQLAYIKTLKNVAKVERVSGPTRYETAAAIASLAVDFAPSTVDTVFVTNAFAWVDGLAAGPVAAAASAPILLTPKDSLASVTASWVADHPDVTNAVVVGSTSVVDDAVITDLEDLGLTVDRVGGINRWETGRMLAQYGVDNYNLGTDSLLLCTGLDFADGLAATPMAGMMSCPIMLTPPSSLSSEVVGFWDDNGPTTDRSYIIGGTPAISAATAASFNDLWTRNLP